MTHEEITGKKLATLPADLRDECYLSPAQTAIFLNTSLATVRRLDWSGKLPFVNVSPRRKAIQFGKLKSAAAAGLAA
jgi:hypothetical protein